MAFDTLNIVGVASSVPGSESQNDASQPHATTQPVPVVPAEGVTKAERYLAKLCKRSFLSLWSYPNIYRDQGRVNGKGDGKELCDLLVVFDNHVIIFSDKDVRFGDGHVQTAWARWYRKAVLRSAEQVWAAERWIKTYPERLYIDRQCTQRFPLSFPEPDKMTVHRIVVAHDAARACKKELGGSGSLMIDSMLVGDHHLPGMPFTIGHVDPKKGYVHVFDDTTLDILLNTLDTITDFTAYLTKKDRFLSGQVMVHAAGDEELLAVYLKKLNSVGEHDFIFDQEFDAISIQEGQWESFIRSPERLAQIESDKVSYLWDEIIERFLHYAMTGTQYFGGERPLSEQEIIFKFLARESRTRRRSLSRSLHQVWAKSVNAPVLSARVMTSNEAGAPYYVFFFLKRKPGMSDEEYRAIRRQRLIDYCCVAKVKFPEALDIVGIASEGGDVERRSEDLFYLDARNWSAKDQAKAEQVQKQFGMLKKTTPHFEREYEYPVNHEGKRKKYKLGRNSPCWCNSGKRFKRCHGANLDW
jgi:hypothetical protein